MNYTPRQHNFNNPENIIPFPVERIRRIRGNPAWVKDRIVYKALVGSLPPEVAHQLLVTLKLVNE